MESWSSWLVAVAVPIAKRIAAALGFGYVTFQGVSSALERGYSYAQEAFGLLTGEVAQLLAMAGFFDALSITAGGVMSSVGWLLVKRWAIAGQGAGS